MNKYVPLLIFTFACLFVTRAMGQNNADSLHRDSLRNAAETLLKQQQQQLQLDSAIKLQIQKDLELAAGDKQKTKLLADSLQKMIAADSVRKAEQVQKINALKKHATGYPVILNNDTLFFVYTKTGSFDAADRAGAINTRLKKLYDDAFFNGDSLTLSETDNGFDLLYNHETLILTVTPLDALWEGADTKQFAQNRLTEIKTAIVAERSAHSLQNWLKRIGLAAIIILALAALVIVINKIFRRTVKWLTHSTTIYGNGITIRKIKLLTARQLKVILVKTNNVLRIIVIILVIYFSLPLLFSLFPETKSWRDTLLRWVLTPAKSAFSGIIDYLPNLFTILVIFFIFRYTIKAIRYFVTEIEKGNISIKGFHADWAKPTFNILKFLLYAFMVVLIWPYLPGSSSVAFQGVSVFVGILISLGSSSAISNMVAGLVITYMRPFKVGDRIKIGDIAGDVIEKTMLVTRIRTIKNEDITIPNSSVLSSSTINYSANTRPEDKGLIIHTTVTIGYDAPWKDVYKALTGAALRTNMVLPDPAPFVLQTSLDDFYVSYQLNAYTKEPNKQALIYSHLHQNIQDCFNEAGIEIMSPHYRAARDGNTTTIPQDYLDKDYKAPSFNVHVNKNSDKA
ncbi:MAG TPA: mechanosensitive ion channel family protein [Chitinophagaceae bacterium]|nr:mechanosensitive ion channel family protein [Chitinophagaceae bacterium]